MEKQMQPLSLLLFMKWFAHEKSYSLLPSILSVPQKGKLLIYTEFGKMLVQPKEICVIQVRDVSPSPSSFSLIWEQSDAAAAAISNSEISLSCLGNGEGVWVTPKIPCAEG